MGLGLGTEFKDHIDNLAEGFLTCLLTALIGELSVANREPEDIAGKEIHHVAQLLQAVGADGGFVVDELVDHGGCLE